MNNKIDFIPVLLGSDMNVYGMARSFHLEYGLSSVAIGKAKLGAISNSKIVEFKVAEPRIEEDEIFCKTLIDFRARYPQNQKLLLVPCGDNYIKLLVRNKDKLKDLYEFECIDEDLLMRLSLKEEFYRVCEEHGFLFPRTTECTNKNYQDIKLPFDFPIAIKPSNSVEYWNCKFPHKKKVFVANNEQEYKAILSAIYSSSYQDTLILQEFIPGDDSGMRVLNCYCGKDKKVKLIAMGNPILEEHSPEGIGSYAAIMSCKDEKFAHKIKEFLEKIGYIGFANFDMKYDPRDGQYKLFEMNLRQGRSSYYVTASGYNLAKYLAEDIIYNKNIELEIADTDMLWTIIPKSIIFKYSKNEKLKAQAKQLIKEGKVCNSLLYKEDISINRLIYFIKNQINYHKKYKKYFGNKGLHE